MATGKTHARFLRLILDQRDLSGDSRQVGSFGVEYAEDAVHGWSNGVVHYTLGHAQHLFSGYQAVFNNTAATGSHSELSARESYILSLLVGIRAAPAVGDPAFLSKFEQMSYTVNGSGPMLVTAEMSKSYDNVAYPKAFGVVLAAGASLSATTNGTSVDNGAASTNGILAHLHVTATSSGNWTLKVQDSPNDSVWSDLVTFSSDGSTLDAEQGTATGTVDRYLRFQATRTAGTTTFWATAVRQ